MRTALELLIHREHGTTLWSGGTTTELAIFPVTANYKESNYLWRLSTATVEAETSVFSALPGISRTLMLLDGQITLRHEGHHQTHLRPFAQDHFDGAWTTHGQGRGIDFNLMCASGVQGELAALFIGRTAHHESLQVLGTSGSSWLALYCMDGDLTLHCEGDNARLGRGDLFLAETTRFSPDGELVIENAIDQRSVLIRCTIHLQANPTSMGEPDI